MSSGSIGSHRAFMGVCVTICTCLVLTLFVGWKWYFESLSSRKLLIDLAKKAEMRAQGLEKMGLSIEAASREPDPPSVLQRIAEPVSTTPSSVTTAKVKINDDGALPAESSIRELPLVETGEDVSQAVALLDKYWKTENWQDKVALVAHSSRVAGLMKDFYEIQKGTDPMPGGLINKARYEIDGVEILYFSYSSSRPNGTLEVAMLRGPDGKFLIDWESLTGYGEMSFRDFREQRQSKPVTLRTYVRLFEYFNFEFSDTAKYLCIKLTSENGESSIYAYCERGTKLANWLERDLSGTGPSGFKGYTVQVSFPPNAQSNQCVRLEKVLAPRWLSLR
jgi:hypothetical protein